MSKKSATPSKISIEYTQPADSNSDDIQMLRISTEDAGAGHYYVIETERWAFDDLNELMEVLQDFKKRLELKADDSLKIIGY